MTKDRPADNQLMSVETEIDIHISMGGQMLAYMTPDDAFKACMDYIDMIKSHYEDDRDL